MVLLLEVEIEHMERTTKDGLTFERYANDYYEIRPAGGYYKDEAGEEFSVVVRAEEDGHWHTGRREKISEIFTKDDSFIPTHIKLLEGLDFEALPEEPETPAYSLDTIESRLENYEGQTPAAFLEEQIEYYLSKRARSRSEAERAHYQRQLDITGRALSIHRTGEIRPQGVSV